MQRSRLDVMQGIWRVGDEQSIPAWAVWLPMFFVAVSLVALLVTPMLIDARLDSLRMEIIRTTDAARGDLDDVNLAFAREVSGFRGFLLTPDESFRETFYESREELDQAFERLHAEADILGPEIMNQVEALRAAHARWFALTEKVLSGATTRQAYLAELERQQQVYVSAVQAARSVDRALDRQVFAQQQRERRVERMGVYLTGLLALLALVSAFFVFWLGARFRRLAFSLDQRARSEENLRQAAQALAAAQDEADVLQYVARYASGIVEAEGSYVATHPSPLTIEIVTGVIGEESAPQLSIPYKASVTRQVYDEMKIAPDMSAVVRLELPIPANVPGADGRPCYVIATTLNAEAEPVGVLVLFRKKRTSRDFKPEDLARLRILADMTTLSIRRLRLLRSEQVARTELEKAIRTRDDVLGVVSHDLRSPLATISLGAAILGESASTDEQVRYVDIIKRMTRRMSRLLQDLLDTARTQSGHALVVIPHEVDVADMVIEACEGVRAQAGEEGQILKTEIAGSLPAVWADRDRILQVLTNLLTNAVKFTGPDGTILVRAESAGNKVIFAVADTGSGISPDSLEHIFDPYWQVQHTAKLGTGLGLPICKQIVDAHGGRIWVESAPDRGSTFYFSLPAVEEGPGLKIPIQLRGEAE